MPNRIRYFLLLMTLHGSLLVTSTIAGSKFFELPFGFAASATVVSYMLTFVVLDVIAELYGRQYSRFVIHLGLLGMAISACYFQIAILLPPADFWPYQSAFEVVLESSLRIWLGGWVAYLLSQYLDVWIFLSLKKRGIGKISLLLRSWLSTLAGQFVDTVVFLTIAFYGAFPILSAIVGQYVVKVIVATITVPLVFVGVWVGRKWMESDPDD